MNLINKWVQKLWNSVWSGVEWDKQRVWIHFTIWKYFILLIQTKCFCMLGSSRPYPWMVLEEMDVNMMMMIDHLSKMLFMPPTTVTLILVDWKTDNPFFPSLGQGCRQRAERATAPPLKIALTWSLHALIVNFSVWAPVWKFLPTS